MFIADNIVLSPFKAILAVFREIYNAAVQEMAAEADTIRAELSQLYLALESGSLTEAAFDARESELLDRLDEIEERGRLEDDGQESDDDDTDDDDDEIEDDDDDDPDDSESDDDA